MSHDNVVSFPPKLGVAAGETQDSIDARRYRVLRNTAPWVSSVVIVHADDTPDDAVLLIESALDEAVDALIAELAK